MTGASWMAVAYEASFADSAHFTRTFKRMFRINPADLGRQGQSRHATHGAPGGRLEQFASPAREYFGPRRLGEHHSSEPAKGCCSDFQQTAWCPWWDATNNRDWPVNRQNSISRKLLCWPGAF